jgi:signal transduction histidine kinase
VDAFLDLGRARRVQWFLRWQLPVVVLTTALVAGLALSTPERLGTGTAIGCALGLVASALSLRLPTRGLLVVPLAHFAAVGLIRSDTGLATVGAIALVPILCLGFHFGRWGVAGAVAGATFVTGLPYLQHAALPTDGTAWLAVLGLPTTSVAIAVIAHSAAGTMRTQRRELAAQADELHQALTLSTERLEIGRGVIESLPIGLVYYAAAGGPRMVNRRSVELAELAGMDLDHPETPATSVWWEDRIRRVPPAEQFVARALSGAEIEAELVWLGEPGHQVAIVASAHQVRASSGRVYGTAVVSLDVTELVESVRVRDQFLATLSHELRTPLVSVVGYLDLIADELVSAERGGDDLELVEMIDTARRSARTLTDRISHLLVAGSADRLTIDLDRVDLGALVAAVVERYEGTASARGVQLRCEVTPVVTTADPHKLDLVVDNLVSNAVKHTGPGGTVEIGLRSRSQIELVVTDTGSGLDRHESVRVFDRFYRTESARRDAVGGLGLGLSICKAVVEAHGGEISMETSPGLGTTVTVLLPARAG